MHDGIIGGAHRRQFGGRIGMGETAADGAAIARLAMADMAQRLGQQWAMPRDFGRQFEIALPHHGADAQPAVAHGDAAQIVDAAEIDQMIDDDVTEIHHRHERLAAGENFGVGQGRQKLGRFLELPRRVIVERRRLHCPGLALSFAARRIAQI